MKPTFNIEKSLWRRGCLVIGIDEVGRGAVAGPVVASAVALATNSEQRTKNLEQIGIDDSKRLTEKKREQLVRVIKRRAWVWGIGEADARIINRVGIAKATAMAMRQAIKNCILSNCELRIKESFILVDGYRVKYLPGGLKNQMAIVKGDRISISIAAASILAKVYRDHKMRLLGRKYPQYGFGRHKGYGTRGHREAIIRHRVTRLHRVLFVKTLIGKMGLDFKKLSVTMAQDEDILN